MRAWLAFLLTLFLSAYTHAQDSSSEPLSTLMPSTMDLSPLAGRIFTIDPKIHRREAGLLKWIGFDFDSFRFTQLTPESVEVQAFKNGQPLKPVSGRILAFNDGSFELQLHWRKWWGLKSNFYSNYFKMTPDRFQAGISFEIDRSFSVFQNRLRLAGGVNGFFGCHKALDDLSQWRHRPAPLSVVGPPG